MTMTKEEKAQGESVMVWTWAFRPQSTYAEMEKHSEVLFPQDKDVGGYAFKGDDYLVGERALLQTGSHYLRTTEELIDYYPLFAGVAAERSGVAGHDTLVVGLPLTFGRLNLPRKNAAHLMR